MAADRKDCIVCVCMYGLLSGGLLQNLVKNVGVFWFLAYFFPCAGLYYFFLIYEVC